MLMNNKIALSAFMLAIVLALPSVAQTPESSKITTWEEANRKVSDVLDLIRDAYMMPVDPNTISEQTIKGMLEDLDPHSNYIPPADAKSTTEQLRGNFEGIGVQFNIYKDTILIVGVISGGPSEKVGIAVGDKIVAVDGKPLVGDTLKNEHVIKALKGPKGTKVTVDIVRKDVAKPLDFVIVRDKIPLNSVDAVYMATPTIGYIKLSRFAATSAQEVAEGIAQLTAQGMKDLILDLKDNGGGLLQAAIDVSDIFLDRGKTITYTQGRVSPRRDYMATQGGAFETGKLIVLIDENSASASEIVSGAIQDWDRGLVVGRRSYGKGLVQKPFNLFDGSQVRLTIAHYYTPSGRCIQKPYQEGRDAYKKDLAKRLEQGELTDSNHAKLELPDSLKFYTQTYKRLVYGGGGVMPDFFVPIDTSQQTNYYKSLSRKNIFNSFSINYLEKNRDKLQKQFTDVKTFVDNYTIGSKMLNDFVAYGAKEQVEPNEKELEVSKNLVELYLKALIARYLFDQSAFYRVINNQNEAQQKAIEIIQNDDFTAILSGK